MAKKFYVLVLMLVSLAIGANAQVVVGTCSNPNIEPKIVRCVLAGDKCYLDGIIENLGPKDIEWYIGGGIFYNTALYDDMGNQYSVWSAKFGNVEAGIGTFPSEVPIKIRLEVRDVSDIATEFKRFDWRLKLDGEYDQLIRFKNIPIVRGRVTEERPSRSSSSSTSTSGGTTLGEDVEGLVNSVNELVNLFKKKK